MNPETTRGALLKIGDEAQVRGWIAAAMFGPRPAEIKDFVVHLGRLSLHYWRPDFTPEQAKLMFQDFAADMAGVTAGELVDVCREYRQDPLNRFFPTPGKLLELLDHQLTQRRRDKFAAKRLLDIFDGEPEPEKFSSKPLPTAAEILARNGVTKSEPEQG